MRCPIDGAELRIVNRQGIQIDYCPNCHGVWLDRGELDKLIERAHNWTPSYQQPPQQPQQEYYQPDPYYQQGGYPPPQQPYPGYHPKQKHKRKREGFLEDLFDFD